MFPLLPTADIRYRNRLAHLGLGLIILLLTGCGQPDQITSNPQEAASSSTPTATVSVMDLGLKTPVPRPEDLTAIAIKQADVQAEQNLRATAAARPTAPPDRLLPTYVPQPTPTLRMGVYESLNCTSDGHYTADNVEFGVYNCWWTAINGQRVRVDAGGDVGNPAALRGGLIVYTNTLDLQQPVSSPIYWTPVNAGVIHIVQIDGTRLIFQSTNGTTFVFDLNTRTWIAANATPTATPTVVPTACQFYPIALHASTLQGIAAGSAIADIFNGSGKGNFGWLAWAGDQSASALARSLAAPGNSATYTNPADAADHALTAGDWVAGSTGASNSRAIRDALDALKGLTITVPVWDTASGQGANLRYHIVGFAQVQISAYQLNGQSRISVVYRGGASCSA